MRELREVLGQAVAVKLLYRLAYRPMSLAGLDQQAAVGNILDYRMLEDVPEALASSPCS